MEITTKSGFTCYIDPGVLDSMELVDSLAEVNRGNSLEFSSVCLQILGDTERKRLYDHLRNDAGRVPLGDVDRELKEIMEALGDKAKNS